MIQQFTPRELDLMRLGAHSNRDTARILGISHKTVSNEWRIIYLRLGIEGECHKRTKAMILAFRLGIIEISEVSPGDIPVSQPREVSNGSE